MKNLTTKEIGIQLTKHVGSMGLTVTGESERWENDGVMHLYVGKATIEYSGCENRIFPGCAGHFTVIITGTMEEDYCEPLRRAGIHKSDSDFIETVEGLDALTEILEKVRPYI